MSYTIPLANTKDVKQLSPLPGGLIDTDLVFVQRPVGSDAGVYRIDIEELRGTVLASVNTFIYIGYADDAVGTGFTTTFDPQKNWLAILGSPTAIPAPSVDDFAGLWKYYGNQDLDGGTY